MKISNFALESWELDHKPPDRDGDDGVADRDDDGGDDEDGEGAQAHVELPLPLLAEVNPALGPELGDLLQVEEEEDRGGEDDAGEPGHEDQPLGSLVWKQSVRLRERIAFSTPIGRGPRMFCSDWLNLNHSVAPRALLCHKEQAQCTQRIRNLLYM